MPTFKVLEREGTRHVFPYFAPLKCLGKSCRQFAMLRADLRLESVGGGAGVAQEL